MIRRSLPLFALVALVLALAPSCEATRLVSARCADRNELNVLTVNSNITASASPDPLPLRSTATIRITMTLPLLAINVPAVGGRVTFPIPPKLAVKRVGIEGGNVTTTFAVSPLDTIEFGFTSNLRSSEVVFPTFVIEVVLRNFEPPGTIISWPVWSEFIGTGEFIGLYPIRCTPLDPTLALIAFTVGADTA